MSEKKVYLIADEQGNMFSVKDWDRLFEELHDFEIEDLYVVQKYNFIIEEAMVELEERGAIEKVTEGQAPLEELANAIDKLAEHLGAEKVEELDKKAQQLINQGLDKPDPSSFMHLN